MKQIKQEREGKMEKKWERYDEAMDRLVDDQVKAEMNSLTNDELNIIYSDDQIFEMFCDGYPLEKIREAINYK